MILRTCCELLRTIAVAIRPVLPFTSDRIGTVLSLGSNELSGPLSSVDGPGGLDGRPITPIPPLFARLELDRHGEAVPVVS